MKETKSPFYPNAQPEGIDIREVGGQMYNLIVSLASNMQNDAIAEMLRLLRVNIFSEIESLQGRAESLSQDHESLMKTLSSFIK